MTRADSYCGVFDAPRWTAQGGQPVLMYHKFGQPRPTARLRALYVPLRLFRAQLAALLRSGRTPLPPADVAGATAGFSVTIDDGLVSALQALPTLVELRVTATLYLVADRLGGWNEWEIAVGEPRERLLDAAGVDEWLAAGQRIGSHTLTHPRLTQLSEAAAREELAASRHRLEDRFQRGVTDLCYPFGDCDVRTRALAAEAGYVSAVTVEPGVVTAQSDPLRLPRLLARPRWPGPGAIFSRLLQLFSRRP